MSWRTVLRQRAGWCYVLPTDPQVWLSFGRTHDRTDSTKVDVVQVFDHTVETGLIPDGAFVDGAGNPMCDDSGGFML